MSGATKIIDASRDGQRIDNYLISQLKGVPKSHIYQMLRTGKIKVNGSRVKQTYRLQTEDEVEISNVRVSSKIDKKAKIPESLKLKLEASVIFEDRLILAINKPSGVAVHPGTNVNYGVIEIFRALRPNAPYLELAHRLDRNTSGCLLIAKNKNTLNELQSLFRLKKVDKEYLVMLIGRWEFGKKTVSTPLKPKNSRLENKKDSSEKGHLKMASTTFIPKQIFQELSYMKVTIGTGRTHQIRIHAEQLGYPVLGDQKYGNFEKNRYYKKKGMDRMFLHASKISFRLPNNTSKYEIIAPLDSKLMSFLDQMQ